MNYPKISIVTPSFNQGHFVEETILSVITQDYPNIEYILIDGGSTDNTIEIVKKYSDRIAYCVKKVIIHRKATTISSFIMSLS